MPTSDGGGGGVAAATSGTGMSSSKGSVMFFGRNTFEVLLLYFPVGIGVVWFWRGAWLLMDYYVYREWLDGSDPDDKKRTTWVSLVLGFVLFAVLFFFARMLERLGALESLKKRLMLWGLLERIFTILVAFASVNAWRGWWYLFDVYVMPDADDFLAGAWISCFVGIGVCLVFGCLRSIIGPPCVVVMDDEYKVGFDVPSYLEARRLRAEAVAERRRLNKSVADAGTEPTPKTSSAGPASVGEVEVEMVVPTSGESRPGVDARPSIV